MEGKLLEFKPTEARRIRALCDDIVSNERMFFILIFVLIAFGPSAFERAGSWWVRKLARKHGFEPLPHGAEHDQVK